MVPKKDSFCNFRLEAFEKFSESSPFSNVTRSRCSSCCHKGRLVYEVHDCSFISSMVQREKNPALLGRLNALCPLKTASCPRHQSALGARAEAGSFCKQGKELPGSNANNHLHWNASGLSCHVCHPIMSPSGQHSSAHCSFPAESEFAIQCYYNF